MKPEQIVDQLKAISPVPFSETLYGHPESQAAINNLGQRLEDLFRRIDSISPQLSALFKKDGYSGPRLGVEEAKLLDAHPIFVEFKATATKYAWGAHFDIPIPPEIASQAFTPEQLNVIGGLTEQRRIAFVKKVMDYDGGPTEISYQISSKTMVATENYIESVDDFNVDEITSRESLRDFDLYDGLLNAAGQETPVEFIDDTMSDPRAQKAIDLAIERLYKLPARDILESLDIGRLEAVVAGLEEEAAKLAA